MSLTSITGIRHPSWGAKQADWQKWRSVYEGGQDFIDTYLVKFSEREEEKDFRRRKRITPTPNFAKAAVNDIKNSIFQRLTEVSRQGGSVSYQEAIKGEGFGVDLHGSSMNGYIGRELLIELLIMSRVGVFVDMPRIVGKTLRDTVGIRPYLYKYRAEDILSWRFRPGSPDEFSSILLRDHVEIEFNDTGLPSTVKERYRHLFIGDDGFVHVRFHENLPSTTNSDTGKTEYNSRQIDLDGQPTTEDLILKINVIPFTMIELSDSLLADVANHQIALLNLESSDINYSLKSNFPFYTEQDDDRAMSPHLTGPASPGSDGTAANKAAQKEIQVGITQGRRYGKGMDRPEFIHPSPEPLQASMEKQAALKADVRMLVNLSLSNMQPKMASAESKTFDERGLDSGLSNIGLELEHAERKITKYWHMLEGQTKSDFSIKYPEKWSLKSDADRREEATTLRELRDTIPSARFQKSISKEIADLLLGSKISDSDLKVIKAEIDNADSYTADAETIFRAVELGILDLKTAAKTLGWPESVVAQAAKDHADRLARISEAQAKRDAKNADARGLSDFADNPGQGARDEKRESRDKTEDDDTSSGVRGKGKEV